MTHLPTPTSGYSGRTAERWREMRPAGNGQTRKKISDLRIVTEQLLPTPTANPGRNATSTRPDDSQHHTGTTLHDIAYADWWGDYADAIAQHAAVMGTPPPPATVEANGGQRLNPAFVEWMMMLPAGWVTDLDIARTNQLKLLGNGVVPLQAYTAFSLLLDGMMLPAEEQLALTG